MRKRAARIAALGLSTIALMSTVVFPIRVQAAEEVGSPIDMPETPVEEKKVEDQPLEEHQKATNATEEQILADEAADLANDCKEELETEVNGQELEGAKEGIDALGTAADSIQKMADAKELINPYLEAGDEESEELWAAAGEYTVNQYNALDDLDRAYEAFNNCVDQLDAMRSEIETEKEKLTAPVEEPTIEEPTIEEPTVEEPKVEEPVLEEPKQEEPISVRFYVAPLLIRFQHMVDAYRYYGYQVVSDAATYYRYGIIQIIPQPVPVKEEAKEEIKEEVPEEIPVPVKEPVVDISEQISGMDGLISHIDTVKGKYKNALDRIMDLGNELSRKGAFDMDVGVLKPVLPPVPEVPVVDVIEDSGLEKVIVNFVSEETSSPATPVVEEIEETEEIPEEELLEEVPEEAPVVSHQSAESGSASGSGDVTEEVQPQPQPEMPPQTVTIQDEEAPKGVTLAGIMERGKWFVALGGVSVAGAGVGVLEAKRRAAMKILDKLNQ